MSTTGEIVMASALAGIGKFQHPSLPSASNSATLYATPFGGIRVPVIQGLARDFVFRDFGIHSRVRRAPKLLLVVERNQVAVPSLPLSFKVLWNPRFVIRKDGTYLVLYKYKEGSVRLKMIGAGSKSSEYSKTYVPAPLHLPIEKLIGRSSNISLVPRSSRVLRKRPKRARIALKAGKGRPTSENVTVSMPRFRETQAASWAQVGSDVVPTYQRSYTPNRTPNFWSTPKNKLPVNPYTCNLVITKVDNGINFTTHPSYTSYTHTTGATSVLFTIPARPGFSLQTNLRNTCISKLRERCNQNVSNLAEAGATYKQFNRMVTHRLSCIVRSIRHLKQGNFVKATDALVDAGIKDRSIRRGRPSKSKTLANNWLELQYGWKPALMDIIDGREALRRLSLADSSVQVVRASAVSRNRVVTPIMGSVVVVRPGQSDGLPIIGNMSTEFEYTYKMAIRFRPTDHMKTFLQQTGFNNPISLTWELLPWSFVGDWVLPIGPFLEGLSANQGLVFLDGSQTYFAKRSATAVISYSGQRPVNAFSYYERYRGGLEELWCVHERTKLTAFPAPEFPTFKSPFSVTHSLNAIALLRSIFR